MRKMARSSQPSAFDGALLRDLAARGIEDVSTSALEEWRKVGGVEPPLRTGGRRAYGFLPASAVPAEYVDRVVAFRRLVREAGLGVRPAVLVLAASGHDVEPRHVRAAFESLATYVATYGHERGAKIRRGPSAWRTLERDLRAAGYDADADELTYDRVHVRPTTGRWLDDYRRSRTTSRAPALVANASDGELVAALLEGLRRAHANGDPASRAPLHALDVLAGIAPADPSIADVLAQA
jgi:hypothetical protein